MATQNDLRAVAGKALADPEFRQKLIDDPEGAIKDAGIELTDEEMKSFKEMDKEQFEQGINDLDERLTMTCWAKVQWPMQRGSVGGVHPRPCVWV